MRSAHVVTTDPVYQHAIDRRIITEIFQQPWGMYGKSESMFAQQCAPPNLAWRQKPDNASVKAVASAICWDISVVRIMFDKGCMLLKGQAAVYTQNQGSF